MSELLEVGFLHMINWYGQKVRELRGQKERNQNYGVTGSK